jgi:hypothetical protein
VDSSLALRPLLLAAVCGGGVLWCLYRFMRGFRNAHLVSDTPLVRLRSAAQGYVKAYGRARVATPEPPRSPLTLRPCVWWSYEIARRERNRSGTTWNRVETEASITPFVLDDGDGECLVGPVCATIVPSSTQTWYGETPWPEGGPALFQTWLPSGTYRYTERRIDVDVALTVVGELRSRSDIGDVASEAGVLLRQWKQDQAELLRRFDANRDGRLSSDEWDTARAAAANEAATHVVRSTIARSSVIQLPTNGEAFLIAPMDGEQLARRERLHALAALALGIVLITAWFYARTLPAFQ